MTSSDGQHFFRMFRYVKPYKFTYGIGTFFYCVQTFAFALMNSIVFGGIAAAVVGANFAGVIDAILVLGAMLLILAVLIGVGAYLYVVAVGYAMRDISMDVFRAFMKNGTESQKHSGEGVAAINTDVNTAHDILSDALTQFLRNVIAVAFSLVTVFIIDWRMGFGALVLGLLILFAQSRFAAPLARLGKAQLETNAENVKSLSNILAGALTIRAYNRQDRSLIQFDKESGTLKKLAFKQAFIGMWQDLLTTVQGWLTLVFVFALGGWLVARGDAEFALILMVFPLAGAISDAMSQMGTTFAALQPPIVAAKRIFEIIDTAAAVGTAANTDEVHRRATDTSRSRYGIEVKDLNFAYKDAAADTLKDIKLSIGENEMVAFVGASGSGKSTLLRTIIGMYERGGLNMEIGGQPFTTENIINWRDYFAYVDQSCKLFDMSIAENIAMGKQGNIFQDEIEEAAKRAFAHDFILEQPEGYATACGEKGASLSGGQKQRLAIARALYRKAPVLVFDEATAALDTESERGIMETIENLRRDHTILITTHNLSNIATADKIVVMDNGRVAECGTHAELLAKGGIYKKLLEN